MSFISTKEQINADAMQQAMNWLEERGIPYHHLPPYQLKIGALNFWPGKGTITIDGEDQRRPEKGLTGLEIILVAEGLFDSEHKG